jgi:hypothetical protein
MGPERAGYNRRMDENPYEAPQTESDPSVRVRRYSPPVSPKVPLLIGCVYLYAVAGGFFFGPAYERADVADAILVAIGAAYIVRAAWLHFCRERTNSSVRFSRS